MAILKELTANVLVNDQPYQEYDRDPECGWGSTKITKYIEAISGVQYKIHINASPSFELPTGCLAFFVLLDGYRVSGQILARRHCGIGRTISQTPPSGQADSRRKFFFFQWNQAKSDPESSGWEFPYFLKRKARTHLTHISQMMVLDVRSSLKFTTFIIPKKHRWGQALVLRHFQHWKPKWRSNRRDSGNLNWQG